jgi:thiamine biosynthesis lipoprotein
VDAASGPLFDLWGFGFRSGEFPSEEEVAQAMEACGMKRMLEQKKGQLNYNAIAQGYSCDLIAEYLYSIGVKDMMVDIGEIFCDGHNPAGMPWSVGIDKPIDGNNELGAQIQGIFRAPDGPHGIVTSGNYRKFYMKDGKKYAHSIDPRTGYPVNHNLLSATIVANDAITADAYATYCMVVGLEESKALLDSRNDLEGCLIYDEEGTFRSWCSEGFVLTDVQTR